MICRQLGRGPCKTYLLAGDGAREAALVDPLLERADDYLELLRREGLRLACVIDTHTHADHLSAGAELQERAGAPYLMHKDSRSSCASRRLEDEEELGVGGLRLRFLHTPGHTQDSLCVLAEGRLLSGDFLFIGSQGAGRLDLPGSDPAAHHQSLRRLDALEDGTALLPAHDYAGRDASTLGEERRGNPVLEPRGREAYLRWWGERKLPAAGWMLDVARANLACTRDPRAVSIPAGQAACACAPAGGEEEGLPRIAPEDLARRLSREPRFAFLLDVRTPEEYAGELGHIAGSSLIPVDELPARAGEVPREAAVVAVCRSGKRAAKAAALLRHAGRERVWVLEGGMLAWNEKGLPVA